MSKFEESNFYKALQDFFINADKKTFLQFLAEFYNRTEGIIDKDNIQDDLIKELRELYLEFNEKGIDENIVREKVNYFLENSLKIKDINSKLNTNTSNIENINSELNNKAYYLTPKMFSGNDTEQFKQMITNAILNNNDIILNKDITLTECIDIVEFKGNIYGNGYTITYNADFSSNTTQNIINLKNCENVKIEKLNITTNTTLTPLQTWGYLVSGIHLDNCKNITVDSCEISKVVDGIHIDEGSFINIINNKLHDLGEEGITIRQCSNYSLIDNEVYNHVGDGFLLKQWTLTDITNATIEGNYFHNGLMQSDNISYGGGITSNAEHSNTSNGYHENIKIKNNKFDGVNYGIILIGATNVDIRENSVKNFSKVGIAFDSKIEDRNENNLPAINWNIENNNIEKGKGFGVSVVTTRTTIDNIKIKNNKFRDLRKKAIQCMNAVVDGNMFSELWGQTAIQSFGNCIIINNDIRSGSTGISNDYTATILSINGEHENETIDSGNSIVGKITIITNNKIYNCSNYGIYARNSKIDNNTIISCDKGIWVNSGTVTNNTIESLTMSPETTTNNQHGICLANEYTCIGNKIKSDLGLIFIRNGSYGNCSNNVIINTTQAIVFEGLMTKINYCTYNYPDKSKVTYNNSSQENPTIIVI